MKKKYVTPHVTMEAFEANEYVAVCWGYDLESGATEDCDQIAHPEKVSFYKDDAGLLHAECTDPRYAYDAYVVSIDKKGTEDPRDDVAHWVTFRGLNASTKGITASTDHYGKIPCKRGVNQS